VSSSSSTRKGRRRRVGGDWKGLGRRREDEYEEVDETHGGGGSSCTGKKAWLNGTGVLEHFLGCIWRDTSASKLACWRYDSMRFLWLDHDIWRFPTFTLAAGRI
jgi:hypothetical protein